MVRGDGENEPLYASLSVNEGNKMPDFPNVLSTSFQELLRKKKQPGLPGNISQQFMESVHAVVRRSDVLIQNCL